jgi:hypothetical protein
LGGLAGCAQIWGWSAKNDQENCVIHPDACGAGQVCNALTEACEGDLLEQGDMTSLLEPPTSFICPGGLATDQSFPRDALYSLEAQGTSIIHYTLDGSNPSPGQSGTISSASPASLGVVAGGTTIHWVADYGASYSLEPSHTFTVTTTSTPPVDFGFIPDPAKFDLNGGSIAIVAPGTHLTGTIQFQAWRSTPAGYCPGCVIQYVAAVEGVGAVGCLNTVTSYGSYPGQSAVLSFAFDAPLQPGRYRVFSGLTLQFSCDGSVGGGPDVGEVIVQ